VLNVIGLLGLVVSLVVGVLLGYGLRGKRRLKLDRVIFWVILVLIFSLGFSIGSNDVLLSSLPRVGLSAVVLSLSAMGFSLLFVKVAKRVTGIE
jgi:uncharacterized membrane protein YbjE (DUF340 family)